MYINEFGELFHFDSNKTGVTGLYSLHNGIDKLTAEELTHSYFLDNYLFFNTQLPF